MISKRTNLLNLEQKTEEPVKKQAVKKETKGFSIEQMKISGKGKNKLFLCLFANADLLESAKAVFGEMKPKELVESALLNCIKAKDEKAFDELTKAIKDKGGDIQ